VNFLRFFEAAIAASFLVSMTDWYFFGVLFHHRYHSTPGVWKKYKNKQDEVRSILVGTLYSAFTCFIFVAGVAALRITALPIALSTAALLWLMIPLPLLLSQAVFMKYDRGLVFAHSAGWLAKLLVSAVCVGLIYKQ
jgi:hypothetical protein